MEILNAIHHLLCSIQGSKESRVGSIGVVYIPLLKKPDVDALAKQVKQAIDARDKLEQLGRATGAHPYT